MAFFERKMMWKVIGTAKLFTLYLDSNVGELAL
jgi:hypothetical protein